MDLNSALNICPIMDETTIFVKIPEYLEISSNNYDTVSPPNDFKDIRQESSNTAMFAASSTSQIVTPSTESEPLRKRSRKKRVTIIIETAIKSEEVPKTFKCDLCPEDFPTARFLRLHKQSLHALRKPFRCGQCPEQFNLERNFSIHAVSHIPAPTTCPDCRIPFQRTAGYVGHLKSHMVNDDFHCKKCDKYFDYVEYYQQHIATEHYLKEEDSNGVLNDRLSPKKKNGQGAELYRKYRCNICNSKFTKASNLTRHKLIHSETKRFHCDECSMKFTQKSTLERHKLLHTGDKNFNCPKCKMRFSQHGNLKNHLRRLHPRNPDMTNKFPCPNCSCVFNKLNSLNRHSAKLHPTKLSVLSNDNDDDSFDRVMACLQNIALPPDNCSLFPNDNNSSLMMGSLLTSQKHLSHSDQTDGDYVKIIETMNADKEKSEVVVKQVQGENGKKYYRCTTCSKDFPRPYDLLRHSRVHTNEKPFQCKICGRCFAIKSNLQTHQRVHEKHQDHITNCYKCPECLKQFSSLRQLDSHVGIHGSSKLFPCQICDKHFRTSSNLRKHEHTHRPKNTDKKEMLESLKQPMTAADIFSTENNETEPDAAQKMQPTNKSQYKPRSTVKPFKCFTCHTHFTAQRSLNTHQKIHLGHKTKQCDQCNAKFRSNTELKRHRTAHSTSRPFFCPYCKKSFKTKETCRVHIRTHAKELQKESNQLSQDIDTTAQHDVISLNTNNEDNTIESIESAQQSDALIPPPSEVPIASTSSSAKFIRLDDLLHNSPKKTLSRTITVQRVEKSPQILMSAEPPPPIPPPALLQTTSPDRKHQCETCGRAFKKPVDLRRHQRTHTQERPFTCDICNVSFKLKCTLETHRLVHDANRTKFDCQVCGKSYANHDVLKVHLRLHTNERPYKCNYCEKTFRTTGHKDAHMRVHISMPREKRSKQKRDGGKGSTKASQNIL